MTTSQLFDAITQRRKDNWVDDVIMCIDDEHLDEDDETPRVEWTEERKGALSQGLWWALKLIETVGYPDMEDPNAPAWTPITVIEDPEGTL
jgi:hypothetical protein